MANSHLESHEIIVKSAIWYWEFEKKAHAMIMEALKHVDKNFEVVEELDLLFKLIEA